MKSTNVATQLSPTEHYEMGIAAAKARKSRSSILRELVQQFLAETAAKEKRQAQKEASV